MKFWCMKQSLSCPMNLIGKPDCDNCDYYGMCRYCGKINTSACRLCEAKNKKENEMIWGHSDAEK